MKCVICHGNEIKVTAIEEEFAAGRDIIRIPLKIPVCKTCGERYYDRRTMQYLEEVENKLATIKTGLKEVGKVLVYVGANSLARRTAFHSQ